MTISMLRGDHGRQRREFEALLQYLAGDVKPDVVLVTNLLLSALAPLIRDRLNRPVIVTLQGDDIFLDALKPQHRAAALGEIRRNCTDVSAYIATSRYYAEHMATYAGLPREAISVVYPGLDLTGHGGERIPHSGPPIVGYFARVDPQKGLHNLTDAFVQLRKSLPEARMRDLWLVGHAAQKVPRRKSRQARRHRGIHRLAEARRQGFLPSIAECAERANRLPRAKGHLCLGGIG